MGDDVMFVSESFRIIKNIEQNQKMIYEYQRYEEENIGDFSNLIEKLREANLQLTQELNTIDCYKEEKGLLNE